MSTERVANPQISCLRRLPFPSLHWFLALAELMNENRALHEHLGFVDCIAEFAVDDGGPHGETVAYQVTFEEFCAVDVRPATEPARADFRVSGPLWAWQMMISSIAQHGGRPALDCTLNHLTHLGEPLRVTSTDPLRRDLYFRYNQSLQEFFNASARIVTEFPR